MLDYQIIFFHPVLKQIERAQISIHWVNRPPGSCPEKRDNLCP